MYGFRRPGANPFGIVIGNTKFGLLGSKVNGNGLSCPRNGADRANGWLMSTEAPNGCNAWTPPAISAVSGSYETP